MELTPALAEQLASLTATLEDPDVDLQAGVRTLGDSVRETVDSFLGVSLTMVVDGYPFTVTTLDATIAAAGIGTSLRFPVPVRDGAPVPTVGTPVETGASGSVVVFYARNPGAFVDLAADITYAQRWSMGSVVLDADVQPAGGGGGGLGAQLERLSVLHQAVGVLLGRGDTLEGARGELERRAVSGGVDVRTAAVDVVASTAPWPPSRT